MRLLRIGIALALATAGYADIITLKSGRVINGTYLGGSPRELKVQIGDEIQTLDISQVARIEFGNGAAAAASSDPDRPTLRRAGGSSADDSRPTLRRDTAPPPPVDDSRPTLRREGAYNDDPPPSRRGGDAPTILRPGAETSSASTPASVAQRAPTEIPAGTNLVVRMIDGVDSDRDAVGKTFQASIDQSITVGGDVVIPRGADVLIKLVDSHEAGKLSGHADLTLSLVSVKVDGRLIDVNTQSITREGEGKGKGTAQKAGGAAGAGVEAVSKGPHVKIPSETRLTFILDNPITI